MTSAIIPAYNEEQFIGTTVRVLHAAGIVDEIIVVDDRSSDETARVAAEAGARVIRLRHHRGKRGAQEAGVRVARGAILLLLDADLGETVSEARKLLEPVVAGQCDMTIAVFPTRPGRGGGMGLVVRLARWGIRRITGKEMQAPLSGQRALRRSVWVHARGIAKGFGSEVALAIDAIRTGHSVLEIPVEMDHRVTGNDLAGILHRARQFLDVACALWVRRGWRRPRPPAHS